MGPEGAVYTLASMAEGMGHNSVRQIRRMRQCGNSERRRRSRYALNDFMARNKVAAKPRPPRRHPTSLTAMDAFCRLTPTHILNSASFEEFTV